MNIPAQAELGRGTLVGPNDASAGLPAKTAREGLRYTRRRIANSVKSSSPRLPYVNTRRSSRQAAISSAG
jgi:hypothetical protein